MEHTFTITRDSDKPPTILRIGVDAGGMRADIENEGQGNATWRFQAADLREYIHPGLTLYETTLGGSEVQTNVLERILGDSESLADADTIDTSDTDAVLAFLSYVIERGGAELSIGWSSDGSAFWLYHDIQHAKFDFPVDENYGPAVFPSIDADGEQRATVVGARAAIRGGIDAAEVIVEVVDNSRPFEDRFGFSPDALGEILSGASINFEGEE